MNKVKTTTIILDENIAEEIEKNGSKCFINGMICRYIECEEQRGDLYRIVTEHKPFITLDAPVLIKNKRVRSFYTVQYMITFCNGFVILELDLKARDIVK